MHVVNRTVYITSGCIKKGLRGTWLAVKIRIKIQLGSRTIWLLPQLPWDESGQSTLRKCNTAAGYLDFILRLHHLMFSEVEVGLRTHTDNSNSVYQIIPHTSHCLETNLNLTITETQLFFYQDKLFMRLLNYLKLHQNYHLSDLINPRSTKPKPLSFF